MAYFKAQHLILLKLICALLFQINSGGVTISCNQYELAVIAPELIKRLRRLAPGLELQFIFSQLDGHKQLQQPDSSDARYYFL